MARGVMRQTNSELNKLRMKNVINYDDEIKNAISISSKESEEEYADDRGETPYYQSFVSLYDFSHHPPRWCHSWACLDGNQIKFYVTRGESEKTLKGVATILSSTHLSRLDSQDRDFCLRLNHIKYNLQTKGSILENTITIGLFNERNASFWQRALQYAVDSCNCDTPATTEPSTPIVSAIFSPDVLPVPPPLPPRNKNPPPISSTDSPSESRKGHRKKKSKIQELLGTSRCSISSIDIISHSPEEKYLLTFKTHQVHTTRSPHSRLRHRNRSTYRCREKQNHFLYIRSIPNPDYPQV